MQYWDFCIMCCLLCGLDRHSPRAPPHIIVGKVFHNFSWISLVFICENSLTKVSASLLRVEKLLFLFHFKVASNSYRNQSKLCKYCIRCRLVWTFVWTNTHSFISISLIIRKKWLSQRDMLQTLHKLPLLPSSSFNQWQSMQIEIWIFKCHTAALATLQGHR